MEMTKEWLEEYRSKKTEIRELQDRMDHLGEDERLIGNDVILDYRKGYGRPQAVVSYDYRMEARLRETYQKRIEKLQEECLEVELWIEGIPDSLTRRIFRMCFVDGLTQKKVEQAVHLDRSRISRKIDGFLKNAHKAQNAHV